MNVIPMNEFEARKDGGKERRREGKKEGKKHRAACFFMSNVFTIIYKMWKITIKNIVSWSVDVANH